MEKSLLQERETQERTVVSRRQWAVRSAIFMIATMIMVNLDAIFDYVLHPEIGYLDKGHLVVGGSSAFLTAVLLGGLWLYIDRLQTSFRQCRVTETSLRESEEKYRNLFEESKDMVFICLPLGKFGDVNPAGVKMLGYSSKEELLQVDVGRDLYVDQEDWYGYRRQMNENGFVENFDVELKRKDGEKIWVTQTATAVYDGAGNMTGCRGMMRDITESKRMEQQLLLAQKMESIGRLSGGVAHDFTNYITAIQGYVDLALMDMPDGPARENLLEARGSSESAASLTRQLMMFSGHQPLDLKPVEINRLIENLQDVIRRLIGERISVSTGLSASRATVRAEAGNIELAIVNLAVYAKSEMPDGGAFSIKTGNFHAGPGFVHQHPDAYEGDFVTLKFSDTGGGMDNETKSHIFEPFFSTRDGDDTGLGLTLVYRIVSQHGGWIEVDSEPGNGSVFTVYLPLITGKAEIQPVDDQPEIALRGNNERLLLVEDDEAVRAIAEKMLGENGYHVFSAGDAQEAFDIFVAQKGDFDLVFSDVVLPGETGVELADHLVSFREKLPVLLVSGYSDTAVDWETVQDRGYRFLQKPYTLPGLLETIREILGNNGELIPS